MHKIAGFVLVAALSSATLGGVALTAADASAAPGAAHGPALVLADGGSGPAETGGGSGQDGSGTTGTPAPSPSPSGTGVQPQTWGWCC